MINFLLKSEKWIFPSESEWWIIKIDCKTNSLAKLNSQINWQKFYILNFKYPREEKLKQKNDIVIVVILGCLKLTSLQNVVLKIAVVST